MDQSKELQFRLATKEDVVPIVAMLADDMLGKQRERFEDPLPQSYYDAFVAIDADPHNELIVVVDGEQIVGCLQLTFIPYLTFQGGWRTLVEGVRVRSDQRGRGLGRMLLQWAIERAREKGCHLIELTSNKARSDAQRFYKSLGFEASHEGYKMDL